MTRKVAKRAANLAAKMTANLPAKKANQNIEKNPKNIDQMTTVRKKDIENHRNQLTNQIDIENLRDQELTKNWKPVLLLPGKFYCKLQ